MFRVILSLLLALSVALTSQSMAVAKGVPAPVDRVVICSGLGTSVVYLDAGGNPTQAPHFCPDCLLSVPLTADSDVPELSGPAGFASALPPFALPLTVLAHWPLPKGRAPPV